MTALPLDQAILEELGPALIDPESKPHAQALAKAFMRAGEVSVHAIMGDDAAVRAAILLLRWADKRDLHGWAENAPSWQHGRDLNQARDAPRACDFQAID